jgi:DNA-directed RNA polymerase specialized sigma subunit
MLNKIEVDAGLNSDLIFTNGRNLTKRQKEYWKNIKQADLTQLAQRYIHRFKNEIENADQPANIDEIEDLVWDCIGRCWKKFDPAKKVKFSTYFHSAVDNAIKDKKDQNAKKKRHIPIGCEDSISYDYDFQIRLPENQAKFIEYVHKNTKVSKAEILRSVMSWGFLYLSSQTKKLAADKGIKRSIEFTGQICRKLSKQYKTPGPRGKMRTYHFDGMIDEKEAMGELGMKPSRFMETVIALYLEGLSGVAKTSGSQAARNAALDLPEYRMTWRIHTSEYLSRQIDQ